MLRSLFALLLTLALLCAALPTVATAGRGDWWMFHHDVKHTGRSAFTGPNNPMVKWAFPHGCGKASPVQDADGTLYVGGDSLYAINPDGTQKWTFANEGNDTVPAIGSDGTIYVGAGDGNLYAVNPNGTKKWAYPTHGTISDNPAIGANGTIYIATVVYYTYSDMQDDYSGNSGILHAINPDGTKRWDTEFIRMGIRSSPAIGADGTIYAGSDDSLYDDLGRITNSGSFLAISPNGDQQWIFRPNNNANAFDSSSAIGSNGTIYIGSNDTNLYAINTAGEQLWAYQTGGAVSSSPALGADGTIYVGSEDGNLYAIHPDGTTKWVFQTGNSIGSSPALGGDGTIYVGAQDGNLYAVNPDGSRKWALSNIGDVDPAIGNDGTIYAGGYAISNMVEYRVTPMAGANGAISPNAAQQVKPGGSLTLIATANAGYTVDTWQLDGMIAQVGANQYTLKNITANHTIKVTFRTIILQRGDWWVFHHDPQHTGRSPFTGPKSAAIKWHFTTQGAISWSSPAIGLDGTVYIGSTDHNLYALKPDGTRKWVFTTSASVNGSPAIGRDGTVYVATADKKFYAITPAGTAKWAQPFTTGEAIGSDPVIGTDDTIYFGTNSGNLYALNPDGTAQWVHPFVAGSAIESSPAIATDGTIYIGTDGGKLYAVKLDGTAKWTTPFTASGAIYSAPTIGADGTIYCGSADHAIYAVNSSGTKKWAFQTNGMNNASPAIGTDGCIYVGSSDKNVYAIKPDGTAKWIHPFATGSAIGSSAAIGADGVIYVGSCDNNLYAITPDGVAKWAQPIKTANWINSSPAIGADGTLYFGSRDGNVYAVGTQQYIITPIAGSNGVISPSTPQTVAYGSSITLTAKPNTAYQIDTWQLDGTIIYVGGKVANGAYTGLTCTLNTITASHAVKVSFKSLPPLTVTPSAGANGSISPSIPQTVNYGTNLTFTATANAGYTVDVWQLDTVTAQTGGAQYVLKTITANHVVKVSFKVLPKFTVTPSAGINGTISPNTPQTMVYGGSLTFTATANAGYTAVSWLLDGVAVQPGGAQYTLTNITANHTVKVTFAAPSLKADLSIANGDAVYLGLGVINLDGTNQTKAQTVASGVTATYLFRVENAGNVTDTVTLTCPLPALSGWTVQVIDRVTNKDITAVITGAGYTSVALAPGVAGGFTLKVTPTSSALSGKAYALLITGTSVKDKTKKDVVKAVTTKQ